eukprot:gene55243-45511_t
MKGAWPPAFSGAYDCSVGRCGRQCARVRRECRAFAFDGAGACSLRTAGASVVDDRGPSIACVESPESADAGAGGAASA